jgi:hypothetical protein
MKHLILVVILLVSLLGFAAPAVAATCLPPQLPSSFYGYVLNGKIGQTVAVTANGIVSASALTFLYQGKVVYSLDVRAYDGCYPKLGGGKEGDKLTFIIAGRVVGASVWHGGTSIQLDLKYSAWGFSR